MGWFDEQIKQRKKKDDDVFTESFINIAGAVMGSKVSKALNDDRYVTKNAIDEILKFYHVKPMDMPDGVKDMNEQLEYFMRPHGIMRREITLADGWYQDATGAMLGTRTDDGSVVALLPRGMSGYYFIDRNSGQKIKLNRKTQQMIDSEAICFYEPFPMKKIGIPQLIKYVAGIIRTSDYVLIGLATLIVTLLGLISPKLNNIIFSNIVVEGSLQTVIAMAVFLLSLSFATLLINSVKTLLMGRIQTRMDISVQAATMMRILALPADFFKKYSSGELSARTEYVNVLCDALVSTILSTGLSSIFSLAYISQIINYAPGLVLPSIVVIALTFVFSIVVTFVQMKESRAEMQADSKEQGMSYALVSGIQKIKLSGAEKRAFARWGNTYAKYAECKYNPPMIIKLNTVITTAISLIGWVVLDYEAIVSGCSVADYYSFTVAFGMVVAAFTELSSVAVTIANFKPIMEMVKPMLDEIPEVSEGKGVLTRLSGGIEVNNVSFRYTEDMPNVIDNLSLKIRTGQYVAIVGSTGCGKSTLMRLLLGFETPQKGAIYYDGRDLSSIDLKSLRRRIGTVMQDGKLFQGDIFSNIVISAPLLTMDDAWKAAEIAGIAQDIKDMPMGMFTMVSEGNGGISGGQRQRLMIARAVAPNPKILMFDEATSALDNITQKNVSEALGNLKCTRIVIAHRLSTIKHCDRIIVLDKGKIIEDGNYDDLVAKNGFFAELVERQRLDQQSS